MSNAASRPVHNRCGGRGLPHAGNDLDNMTTGDSHQTLLQAPAGFEPVKAAVPFQTKPAGGGMEPFMPGAGGEPKNASHTLGKAEMKAPLDTAHR